MFTLSNSLGKKEGLGIQPLAEVLLEDPARPPVLLLAIGVALLGVAHALHVGVARGVVVAAGLLEHVGHLSSFLFWTNLIVKEGRGFCNPLHKMNIFELQKIIPVPHPNDNKDNKDKDEGNTTDD